VVKAAIREVPQSRYLTKQRRTLSAAHREVARVCRARGLPALSRGCCNDGSSTWTRSHCHGAGGYRRCSAVAIGRGTPPPVNGLLEQVQIDHTVIDVAVVDVQRRLPIGRPCITVAISGLPNRTT
jgi:putative transposase